MIQSGKKGSTAKALGVFSLAMITAGSVDSIRNLPATALFGSSLIFFFILAAIFFLLPSALVSAELASNSDNNGGVYVWVKNAFGQSAGFLAIWFQWIENVIWYPTILSFVAGTIAYMIHPALATNKLFLIAVIVCSFWGVTIINLLGIKASAWFANVCALFGLLLPMVLIITLGIVWFATGHLSHIHFSARSVLPEHGSLHMWVALTGIILSFCGMEIATVHSFDVKDPQRSYPRAMLIATVIIVVTLILGALSIAVVLPETKISLVAGIMQAFTAFFTAYHLVWVLPIIAVMLVIGGMGSVNNWVIAPTRGLLIAMKDINLSKHLQRENRFNAPSALLIYQAVIVTLVCAVFLLFPVVNAAYWLLTALAEQLYMIMYLIMFVAAIRLRYVKSSERAGFRIPGIKNIGMWVVAGAGFFGALVAFMIGFMPPDNIRIGSTWHYELLLMIGLMLMSAPPFLMRRKR